MLKHPLLYFTLLLLLLSGLPVLAQQNIRISGTVFQSDKKTPIPGATITRVNSHLGVLTDENGAFLIDVSQQDTLMVRAVGFKPLMYLPKQLPVSEVRVNIVLQEDSVMLGEVEVTSRPSKEMIDRALRNMKREQVSQVKRPGYIPGLEPPPPPEEPAPTIASPVGLLYNMLSREGKELKKLQELKAEEELKRKQQEKKDYNRFFKDNTGYQ
ncbi:carboxypeptidase-like regulatory domain-containing protein [Pontibacter silvestris]|uniref:Carboxypeptidase-like regulatory domain-containing protein n=1 Tax=Pontibacter silvestris TaxID=2305183 RepID=A0ABW4WX83_9BACT